jgi:hypothetical protein
MKKLQIATNGHPRTNNDLLHLQEAIMEIGSALGMLCTDSLGTNVPIVVGGLNFTSLGSGLFTLGAGYIYYQNEMFYFPGNPANLDPPDYLRISSVYAANNPYLGKNIHNIRTIVPIYGSPIAGDVAYSTLVKGVDAIAKKSIGQWQPVYASSSGIYPRLNAGCTTPGGNPLQFRKNGDGSVEFKGSIVLPSGTTAGSILSVLFGGPLNISTPQGGCVFATLSGESKPLAWLADTSGILLSFDTSYTTVGGDAVMADAIRFYENL